MIKQREKITKVNWHRVKTVLYIYTTFFKRNWGTLFLLLIGVVFSLAYALPYTIGFVIDKDPANIAFSTFQTEYNYAFMYGAFSGLSLAIGSFVFRTYSSMRYNVMYKRIGLLGIKGTDFVISYWISSLIFTVITLITNIIVLMITMGAIWSQLAGATTNQYIRIIFNKNFVVDLFYILVFVVIITGMFLMINSIFLNPTIGYWLPSTLFLFVILGFLLISLIPSFLSSEYRASWFSNTYYFYTNYFQPNLRKIHGISTWKWYIQLIFFLLITLGTLIFAGWSSYIAIKKFKWAN